MAKEEYLMSNLNDLIKISSKSLFQRAVTFKNFSKILEQEVLSDGYCFHSVKKYNKLTVTNFTNREEGVLVQKGINKNSEIEIYYITIPKQKLHLTVFSGLANDLAISKEKLNVENTNHYAKKFDLI